MTEYVFATIGLAIVAGFFDWIRGSTRLDKPVRFQEKVRKWTPKPVACLIIGACVALVAPVPDAPTGYLWYIMGAVALGVGVMIQVLGVGNAVGPALTGTEPREPDAERWQKGPLSFLNRTAWGSLVALGVLTGLPTLALLYWTTLGWLPIVAFAIATPAAAGVALAVAKGTVRYDLDYLDEGWAAETKRSGKAWGTFNAARGALTVLLCGLLLLVFG